MQKILTEISDSQPQSLIFFRINKLEEKIESLQELMLKIQVSLLRHEEKISDLRARDYTPKKEVDVPITRVEVPIPTPIPTDNNEVVKKYKTASIEDVDKIIKGSSIDTPRVIKHRKSHRCRRYSDKELTCIISAPSGESAVIEYNKQFPDNPRTKKALLKEWSLLHKKIHAKRKHVQGIFTPEEDQWMLQQSETTFSSRKGLIRKFFETFGNFTRDRQYGVYNHWKYVHKKITKRNVYIPDYIDEVPASDLQSKEKTFMTLMATPTGSPGYTETPRQ